MRVKKVVKDIVKRFKVIDLYCKNCGDKISEVWLVDDDLYKEVTGNPNKEYCIKCFNKMAKQKDIYLMWTANKIA